MAILSDDEVRTALVGLSDWQRAGDEIIKTFALPSFPDAIAFVTRIGFLAERADHHPDLDIRWRNVRVALSTHSEHGITQKDVALAGEIQALVGNG